MAFRAKSNNWQDEVARWEGSGKSVFWDILMFKCLKCDEIVTDGSRICRKCGSIIDEVPDSVEESFVMAESVPIAEVDDEAIEVDEVVESASSSQKQWHCAHCSAQVPVHFMICWKCQHPRSSHDDAETSEPEPISQPPIQAELACAKLSCPKCALDELVPNARIHVIAGGRLQVTVEPDKDSETPGLLTANVCQRCGYVELRAAKP